MEEGRPHSSSTALTETNVSHTLPEEEFNLVTLTPILIACPDDDVTKLGAHTGTAVTNGCSSALTNGCHSAVNGNIKTDDRQGMYHHLESTDLTTKLREEWNVRPNPRLVQFNNPIRQITDSLILNEKNGKDYISLAQGDPAQFGPHMKVPEVVNSALIRVIQDGRHNGYAQSQGLPECRRALADYLSKDAPYTITPEDVIMTAGATQGLNITINALTFKGCNMLLPRPGFPLYEAHCRLYNVEFRYYDLLDERNSEVDLDQVAALADENTAAMIVCNPGNPSGAVFTTEHASQIATLAGALKVPIISDEVYASMAFGRTPFVSMAQFSSVVPVLAIGGMSKGWLAPGWRLGWIGIWDPNGILRKSKVLEGMLNLMKVESAPPTPVQASVPYILKATPDSFWEETRESLRSGADLCFTRANRIQGLEVPTRPEGSMFMMVRVDLSRFKNIESDIEFSKTLLKEESVLVLPGSCFGRPSWFRLVFALSVTELGEAWDRIEAFCSRHALQP